MKKSIPTGVGNFSVKILLDEFLNVRQCVMLPFFPSSKYKTIYQLTWIS